MMEDWKDSLDNGNIVGTISVDLSKAFDSLPHGLRYVMPKATGWLLKGVARRDQYLGPFYSTYL